MHPSEVKESIQSYTAIMIVFGVIGWDFLICPPWIYPAVLIYTVLGLFFIVGLFSIPRTILECRVEPSKEEVKHRVCCDKCDDEQEAQWHNEALVEIENYLNDCKLGS